jgi:putative thiamine transport system permease protein
MGPPIRRQSVGRSRLRLFPAAALILLVAPVAAGLAGIIAPAFGFAPWEGRGGVSLEPFRELFAMPGLLRSSLLSLATGLAATLVALAATMLFVGGWRGTRLFALLHRLLSPLLSVPHAAAAFALAFLIAPSGLIVRALFAPERPPDILLLNDPGGVAMTVALVAKEMPFLFLMALAALPQTRAAESGRMMAALGYGRLAAFAIAVAPPLYRQLRLPVFAVLAYATSVVDVALVLGPTLPPPLAVRILDWQRDPDLAGRSVAAAGAVLQFGVTALAIVLWLAGERACRWIGRRLALSGWRARRDASLRTLGAVLAALPVAIVLAGMAVLALWSVAGRWWFPEALPADLTLATWRRLLAGMASPLAHTLVLAFSSAGLAVALALGALEARARRRVDRVGAQPILYVPLLVPQVAFLFGLQALFAWLAVDGTLSAVLLVHLVFVLPYVLLSLDEPWRSFDPRYAEIVRTLGRGPAAVFFLVRVPLLARAILTALAVGFAVSVGLYLPTLLVGAGRAPTVTTEAVALASGGDRRLIGAAALLQALLPFLGFAAAGLLPALLFRKRRALRIAA